MPNEKGVLGIKNIQNFSTILAMKGGYKFFTRKRIMVGNPTSKIHFPENYHKFNEIPIQEPTKGVNFFEIYIIFLPFNWILPKLESRKQGLYPSGYKFLDRQRGTLQNAM